MRWHANIGNLDAINRKNIPVTRLENPEGGAFSSRLTKCAPLFEDSSWLSEINDFTLETVLTLSNGC